MGSFIVTPIFYYNNFGAFITRYFGFEGECQLEKVIQKMFLYLKTYLTILIDGEINGKPRRKKLESEVLFSGMQTIILMNTDFNDERCFEYVDFVENVYEDLVLDDTGHRYLKIVEASDGNRREHYIKEGEITNSKHFVYIK